MAKKLMKGCEAVAEADIQAGCHYFFGYPITPQNDIPEYMARRLPQVGGCFLQAESEVAAINMVYGAAAAGARCMTSSSSPGISLKQEGMTYLAGAELPCVVVNMVRGGPGLAEYSRRRAIISSAQRAADTAITIPSFSLPLPFRKPLISCRMHSTLQTSTALPL